MYEIEVEYKTGHVEFYLFSHKRRLPSFNKCEQTDELSLETHLVGGGEYLPSTSSLSASFCSPCITARPRRNRSA